jgi:hypothetical protein
MKKLLIVPLTLVSLHLLGCADSEDPAAPEVSELSAAEAALLAGMLAGNALGSTDGPVAGGTAGPASVPFDFGVNVTLPCPLGGEVTLQGEMAGDIDPEAETLVFTVTASQVHSSCAMDAQGVTVSITGNPGLEFWSELSASGDPPEGTQAATLTGGFDWETSDERSGTCAVDLSMTRDFGLKAGNASGTFCGHTVEVSVG